MLFDEKGVMGMSLTVKNSNDVSVLFSSLNNTTKKSSGSTDILGINYSELSSIKNGSYYKLLKQYYAKEADASASTSTSEDSTATLTSIKSSAEDMTEAADALLERGSKSVFAQKTTTAEDGTKTTGYDTDAIYGKMKEFVDSYNSLVKTAGSSNVTGITVSAASMVNNTKVNAKMLSKIGISINSKDNTLSIDEDTFKKADMSTVKNMFNSRGSFGYQVSVQASMIKTYVDNESIKANTYTKAGSYSYNYSSGSLLDSIT